MEGPTSGGAGGGFRSGRWRNGEACTEWPPDTSRTDYLARVVHPNLLPCITSDYLDSFLNTSIFAILYDVFDPFRPWSHGVHGLCHWSKVNQHNLNTFPRFRTVFSCPHCPTRLTPTGHPSSPSPIGTLNAGSPASEAGTVSTSCR